MGQLNGCPPATSLCLGIHTEAEEEGSVLNMSQIDVIREMARKGCRLAEICRATGHDPKTVRKYLEEAAPYGAEDPRPPVRRGPRLRLLMAPIEFQPFLCIALAGY